MEKELEKKIIRKGIFIFLIVGTIFGSIAGVTAYTISAKEIGYSPKDSSWKVNNVADAIESLKTLKGGSTNYSLDEQVVGTWIDGKPIYQKTYNKSGVPQGRTTFEANFLNNNKVDRIVNIYAVQTSENVYNSSYSESNGNTSYANVDSPNGLTFIMGSTSATWTVSITVQYTKTTDNATNS